MLTSMVCRYADFHQDWYVRWAEAMGLEVSIRDTKAEERNTHRKAWEWCAIAEALQERGLLRPGRSGIGFAVGTEPLASVFAAEGVSILGTDLASDPAGWSNTNQHASSLEELYHNGLVSRGVFDANVKFQPVDMKDLSVLSGLNADFVWSSCSFEHLGSLEAGLNFVLEAMQCVKPGGYAVHTTEYNVSSNSATLTSGPSVIYRRQDIESLSYALRSIGCALETPDFDPGSHRYDIEFDYPPYFYNGRKHIKLLLGQYVSTSMLLIIRKGEPPPADIAAAIETHLGKQ
ncbi:methyltransferase domain-containing protein [Rhodopila globiformis]|uniref:methyltransferase domain-containing protein n=1 Tax=Rhodopila globiformis TaxID=1071 RepID=UPI001304A9AD|nr:methyltransferase domain-containing protein [Rhodopila globiformis]